MLDNNAEALAELGSELGATVIACDARQELELADGVAQAIEANGSLDGVVNIVGGNLADDDQLSEATWEQNLSLNLLAPVRLIRLALPSLSEHGGNVVLVGSLNGLTGVGGYAYSAAKAGLSMLVKNLAADYSQQGIRFNVVAPGTIQTDSWGLDPHAADVMLPLTALSRVGQPDDVAAAVAYLASDDAAWVTGTTLTLDGGQGAGPQVVITKNFSR